LATSSGDDDCPRVMKLFENNDEYNTELANLKKLRDIRKNLPDFAHVSKLNRAQFVTKVISGRVYSAIIPYRRVRQSDRRVGGQLLKQSHCLQILKTLEAKAIQF